jgi:uncharacterized phage protein (TIGR02218 family)
MSYAVVDTSRQDGNPALLYTFNRGSAAWYYIAAPSQFLFDGHYYLPEVISSSPIASTGEVPKDTVTITLPITNALAASFLAWAPDEVTTVSIFRTHFTTTPDGLPAWTGRVLSVATSIATVTLTCEHVGTSVRRMGLRQLYQRTCRHMLYGLGCNVDKSAYAYLANIFSVDRNLITVLSTGTLPNFVGGTILASDNTLRMIVAQSAGNVLTLMRPVQALIADFAAYPGGFTSTLYPGCDKSTTTCRDKFGNLGNYGGFPGITGINPTVSNVF